MTTANSNTLADKVAALLAEKKMVMLDTLAQTCGVSELQAAEALPQPHAGPLPQRRTLTPYGPTLQRGNPPHLSWRHGGALWRSRGQILRASTGRLFQS